MSIFNLPDLGEGLAEAEIREWYVKVGDTVKVDQPLVAMETAKALVDVPSPQAGKIAILHGNANDIIQTGAPLVTFESEQASVSKGTVVGALQESDKAWQEAPVVPSAQKTAAIKAMPAARLLATQLQVDLATVSPTGPQGLITVEDVKKAATKTAETMVQGEPLRGLRRAMAQTMAAAHAQVVPATVCEEADITAMSPGTDITVRLLKAMALAAKEEPALNAWFDGNTFSRQVFSEVNIGLAVDTPEGLLVPVVRDVGTQSAAHLRERINHYKEAAKSRSLQQADLQGATLVLSNFGTITGRFGTPVVVPPTVAILACGRSRETVVVREGQMVIARVMPLSLTIDHRAVTGGEATRFLAAVIAHLIQ